MDEETPDARASDADRDATVNTLQDAVSDGRLTLDEFGERVGRALAAGSRGELAALTADLPEPQTPVATPTSERTSWIFGILGGGDRKGRWRLPARCRVINVMGGADLDLRHATISAPVSDITVVSIMGGSDIVVPDNVEVDLRGFALFGGNDLRTGSTPAPPGAPLLRVRAISIMGGTDVKRA